ncbi:MAG: cupredoxin domain-containing protein [Chloroflexota bacterium]
MRVARLVLALVSILAVAGCSSGAAAGWTYAPAPAATPRPSVAPSGSAEASAGASGSPAASGSPEASGSGAPAGDTVTITASSAAKFDTPDVSTAAGKPFTLTFDNQDSTAPHNVVLTKPDGSPVDMGDNQFFVGPAKHDYKIGALDPGAYPFHCQVHPNMTGTLTVK